MVVQVAGGDNRGAVPVSSQRPGYRIEVGKEFARCTGKILRLFPEVVGKIKLSDRAGLVDQRVIKRRRWSYKVVNRGTALLLWCGYHWFFLLQ
jgi:hypothetical protein